MLKTSSHVTNLPDFSLYSHFPLPPQMGLNGCPHSANIFSSTLLAIITNWQIFFPVCLSSSALGVNTQESPLDISKTCMSDSTVCLKQSRPSINICRKKSDSMLFKIQIPRFHHKDSDAFLASIKSDSYVNGPGIILFLAPRSI